MRTFFLTLWLLTLSPVVALATTPTEQKIQQGLESILDRHYEAAEEIFSELQRNFPGHPIGLLGKMAIYQARMYENFDWKYQQDFEKAAQENHQLSRATLNNKRSRPKDLLAAAASFALESYHEARKDNFLKALNLTNQVARCLNRIRAQDPHLEETHDRLLGLGLYDYWKSVAVLKFRFIPMLWLYQDRRERGLARVNEVIQQGPYLAPVAKLAKAMILLEKNEHRQGIELARGFLKEHPRNIIMKNFLGIFLVKDKQFNPAEKIFAQIRREAPEVHLPSYYAGVMAHHRGRLSQALAHFAHYRSQGPNFTWSSYALYNEAKILQQLRRPEEARIKEREAKNRTSRLEESLAIFQPPLTETIGHL